MSILLAAGAAYLLGSISPSFFLGKLVKGIDIRQHGDHNAGGANTLATVGVVPGIAVALFDLSKGLIALLIASSLFGLSGELLLIPIAAAIAGHVFPFYLQFRGGQGAGTAVGVFGYYLFALMIAGRLPWETVALVGVVGAVVALVAPTVEFIGVAMIPLLIYLVLHYAGLSFPASAMALLLVFLLGVTSYNFLRKGILRSDAVIGRNWGMIVVTAAGTGVLLLRCLAGREAAAAASVVAVLGFGAAAAAGWRRARRRSGDAGTLATESALFYLGALLVTLLFPRPAACLALAFLVGGSLFGELFGSEVGFRPVTGAGTFRRAVVFFCGCLAAGEIVSTSLGLTLPPLFVGAAAAFAAAFFLPRPYETAAAGLLGGLALWIIGLPLL